MSSAATRMLDEYPTTWTKGHDEALTIFCTSLALVRRDLLHSLPFFRPWSANGWTPLSQHVRKHARGLLAKEGSDFEMHTVGRSNGSPVVPQQVAQAMEDAIMKYSGAEGQRTRVLNRRKAGRSLGLSLKDPQSGPDPSPLPSESILRRSSRPSAAREPNALRLKLEPLSDDDGEAEVRPSSPSRKRQRRSYEDSSSDEDADLWKPQLDSEALNVPVPSSTSKIARPRARPLATEPNHRATRELPPAAVLPHQNSPILIDLTLDDDD